MSTTIRWLPSPGLLAEAGGNRKAGYVSLGELARGGMGILEVVVAPRDPGRLLVRKRLLQRIRGEASYRDMFFKEAKIASLIEDHHVVPVLDYGEDAEGPFLLMPFFEGVSLSSLLSSVVARRSRLSTQVCLRIGVHIAHGLSIIHGIRDVDGKPMNLVHRDVSPQNVLVCTDGDCRLTDFGIVKAQLGPQTEAGVLKGKMGYMAPEQLRFEDVDHRADLFALGVMLWETLAGKRFYDEDSDDNVATQLLTRPTPDIRRLRADTPGPIVELLAELLAKDPSARPRDAMAVVQRIAPSLLELVKQEGIRSIADQVFSHCRNDLERQRSRFSGGLEGSQTSVGRRLAARARGTEPSSELDTDEISISILDDGVAGDGTAATKAMSAPPTVELQARRQQGAGAALPERAGTRIAIELVVLFVLVATVATRWLLG